MENKKTILVCPLNWGLGHASRDIPIIKLLIKRGFHIVFASEEPLTKLVKEAIPEVETDFFPGPKITYASGSFLILKLVWQLPNLIIWLFREKKITKQLIKKHNPYAIISDNRYRVRDKHIKSIIITHQLMVKMPFCFKLFEKPLHLFIKNLVSKFDQCWIPDNKFGNSLAGDLVHKYSLPQNAKLIGPISRFMDDYNETQDTFNVNILVVLSGPEPQKSILKKLIINKFKNSAYKLLIVIGDPNHNTSTKPHKNIKIVSHLSPPKMRCAIEQIPIIICRSGYSSLMDLYYLGKKAIIIPTPGQTEQEYIAKFNIKTHAVISQKELKQISVSSIISKLDSSKKIMQNPSNKLHLTIPLEY